jgi:exodeoxyribonuclease VII large subunit
MPRKKSLSLGLDQNAEVLTVSALNREVRQLIEESLGSVWVEGEISNLAKPSSGHIYFSLKDEKAQVRCAMFRQQNRSLGFEPKSGLKVLVHGKVSLYEPRGDYQLIVEHMEEAGVGALRRRFEALKAKLEAEGLFDPARKRELPTIPERIGVITSPTGAALRDVLISLKRRFPATKVLIYPTSVQGDKAAGEIVAALERASSRAECDLLILTRGGGSLEDLWPFNEEIVARAVDAVSIPIIAAVGHETDFTIAEFVADLRAPTPSQAAELAVPLQDDYVDRLLGVSEMLERILRRFVRDESRKLDALEHRLGRAHPGVALRAKQMRVVEIEDRIKRALKTAISEVAQRIQLVERGLVALSPLATLERGYAIVTTKGDGKLVTTSAAVKKGTQIDVRLAEGELEATVNSTTRAETR